MSTTAWTRCPWLFASATHSCRCELVEMHKASRHVCPHGFSDGDWTKPVPASPPYDWEPSNGEAEAPAFPQNLDPAADDARERLADFLGERRHELGCTVVIGTSRFAAEVMEWTETRDTRPETWAAFSLLKRLVGQMQPDTASMAARLCRDSRGRLWRVTEERLIRKAGHSAWRVVCVPAL